MELDDFKSVLKTKLEAPTQLRSAQELEQSIHGKTASVIDKIKRSILFELVLYGLFLPLGWLGMHYPSLYVRCIFAILGISSILFIIYTVFFYRNIRFFETRIPTVKERLQQIIDILQRFTRLYFRFTMWTLPLVFVLGLVAGWADVLHQPQIVGNFHWGRGLLLYAAFFIAWSAVMYFFTKWYIKRLYGNYLQQLKDRLKDLENG